MKNMSYLLILILGACVSHKPSFTNIELSIYPASGGEIGYNIIIQKETIKTEVRELAIEKNNFVLGKSKSELQRTISKNQTDSINHYYILLSKTKQDIDSSLVLDTWIYVLKVNNKEIARFNSSTIASQKDELRRFVIYVIGLSPIKLKLLGFS